MMEIRLANIDADAGQTKSLIAWTKVRLLAVIAATVLLGCSSQNLSVVQGIVSLDGTPLKEAQVIFMSQQDQAPVAMAITNMAGEFVIATSGNTRGLPPGAYKVVLFKLGDISSPGQGTPQPPRFVPAIYSDVATTPLSIEVPTSGDVTFELNSQ